MNLNDYFDPVSLENPFNDHLSDKAVLDPRWEPVRKSLGYTLTYANRMNLASMIPRGDLASTRYCLANSGVEYLVYLPDGGKMNLDLSAASGTLAVEWFNPNVGEAVSAGTTTGGDNREFAAPFGGDAVLYITGER